jgi:hypothetical protein
MLVPGMADRGAGYARDAKREFTLSQRNRLAGRKHDIGATADSRFPPAKPRCCMDEEPKTPAELKEIRIERKRAQDADGIKAMAEIAAADVAIRKRTAKLRALRLAKEAADTAKPAVAKTRKKKST